MPEPTPPVAPAAKAPVTPPVAPAAKAPATPPVAPATSAVAAPKESDGDTFTMQTNVLSFPKGSVVTRKQIGYAVKHVPTDEVVADWLSIGSIVAGGEIGPKPEGEMALSPAQRAKANADARIAREREAKSKRPGPVPPKV